MCKIKKLIAMSLLAISIIVVEPINASAAWVQDNSGWWYSDGDSWATGWRNIDGNWYYFSPQSGYMYASTTVDGYFVDEDGVWIDDSYFNISARKAQELIREKYYAGTSSSQPYIRCYDFDDKQWYVRAYDDNKYKTTNVGWYYLDKNTGVVTSMF